MYRDRHGSGTVYRTYDIAVIMVKAGLGIAGLFIIILSTVTTTFLDAFFRRCIQHGHFPCSKKEKWAAIAVTVIGTIAGRCLSHGYYRSCILSVPFFAPMIAIQIADTFILKNDFRSTKFHARI